MNDNKDHLLIETIPRGGRKKAWLQALDSLSLTCAHPDSILLDYGEIITKLSLTGMKVTVLRSSAQEILYTKKISKLTASRSIAILFHIQGDGSIRPAQYGSNFTAGDVTVCDFESPWSLQLRDDFNILLVELPRERIFLRLGLYRYELPIVLTANVAVKSLCSLLGTIASNINEMERVDLTSIETVLTELVTSALLCESKSEYSRVSQVQAALVRRVYVSIEARLSDANLMIADLAKQESVTPRYLQRLFKLQKTTFTYYLRHRRLERCKIDLLDPKHAGQNLTDIAFRWGFRDGSTFSRAFKNAYGQSPRDMRSSIPHKLKKYPNRGLPLIQSKAPNQTAKPEYRTESEAVKFNKQFSQPLDTLGLINNSSADCPSYQYLPVNKDTIHWGHLGQSIPPKMNVGPDALVTIETLTHHGFDDYERMIKGDVGAESVFHWTAETKAVDRRGAGPIDGSILGRGAGEGFGVHICTGPIYVRNAEPGDVLEVQILDLRPRPSANPKFHGKAFGSNAAAWWGFQYGDHIDQNDIREVITIYETDLETDASFAQAVYSYRWTPQTDPFGVIHKTIDYPGIPVDHKIIEKDCTLRNTRIPARLHFGFMGVAPREADLVDSIPPSYFGGNMDSWRITKGTTLYLPVAVPGALFSVGDPHFTQGDGEINGTALELSLTGDFHLILHKKGQAAKPFLQDLSAPLLETEEEWVLHDFSYSNYLRDLGRDAQSEIYSKSSVDLALRNAFRSTRRFLMENYQLGEDEAISVISLAVDFGITQVADGNWGVHAIIKKKLFSHGN